VDDFNGGVVGSFLASHAVKRCRPRFKTEYTSDFMTDIVVRSVRGRIVEILPLALILAFFLWTSFYGLNFGVHWDETRGKFDSIRDTLNTGFFIQGAAGQPDGFNYNYGGVNYVLTWSGFAPEIFSWLRTGPRTLEALSDAIGPLVYDMDIRFRVRSIYLITSSLSIVWLYSLARALQRNHAEALFAAAILAASWEVAYHSRWIAPDTVMMQFALLCFLCLVTGSNTKRLDLLYFGAIAAGLTAGTKYNGGLLFPCFLLGAAIVIWEQRRSLAAVVKHSIGLTGTTALVFVLTTPGIVVDPFRFFIQLDEQYRIYSTGFYGHTVKPGWTHFYAISKYIFLQVFSHYWIVSSAFAVFCLIGIVYWLTKGPKLGAALILLFVAVYTAYYAQQSVLIVRNLLVIVPFLCLAVARGVMGTAEMLQVKVRLGTYAVFAILLSLNFGWETYASHQIKRRSHLEYFLAQFEQYVRNSPRDTFFISSKLNKSLTENLHSTLPPNIVTDPRTAYTKVAFLQSEGPDTFWERWPQNWWGMYERTFGPLEVNLEAYPTFVGNERILVVTRKNFEALPLRSTDLFVPPADAPLATFGQRKFTVHVSRDIVTAGDRYILTLTGVEEREVFISYALNGKTSEFRTSVGTDGSIDFHVAKDTTQGTYNFLAVRSSRDAVWVPFERPAKITVQ
jgi:hypothetical protein